MPSQRPLPSETAYSNETTARPTRRRRKRFEWFRFGAAFWTVASIFSMAINIVLLVLVLSLGQQLFSLKQVVEKQVLGGLYDNFVQMDQAHIKTTIPVSTEVPAKFDLPLNTTTTVTLTEDTHLTNATIYELNAGGALYIPRANTNIILPAGTTLPIKLDLVVPVDQKIPVNLTVAVDIPLDQTDLHKPFVGLRDVVQPYYDLLNTMPNTWQEALCGTQPSNICRTLVH